MLLPWILCIILAVALVVVVANNFMLKKSINEICADFEYCLSEDTNVQISISSGDKTIRYLANAINQELSQLRKMKQQYSNGDRELKDAVTNISHDLRTPLTAICGYLDLLETAEQSEDAKRYVEQIRNRSEVLKQLTEELFRYSVIASTPEMSYEKVDIRRVLEESILSFEGEMHKANIAPAIEMPSSPMLRNLDNSALTRIFGNIISNAIKYSDGDLNISLQESGTVIFSNTAKALSTVEVGKLFDRFYTVDSARKSTGLGLSIAKLLTERMHGTIEARYENTKLMIILQFL